MHYLQLTLSTTYSLQITLSTTYRSHWAHLQITLSTTFSYHWAPPSAHPEHNLQIKLSTTSANSKFMDSLDPFYRKSRWKLSCCCCWPKGSGHHHRDQWHQCDEGEPQADRGKDQVQWGLHHIPRSGRRVQGIWFLISIGLFRLNWRRLIFQQERLNICVVLFRSLAWFIMLGCSQSFDFSHPPNSSGLTHNWVL